MMWTGQCWRRWVCDTAPKHKWREIDNGKVDRKIRKRDY